MELCEGGLILVGFKSDIGGVGWRLFRSKGDVERGGWIDLGTVFGILMPKGLGFIETIRAPQSRGRPLEGWDVSRKG